MYILQVFTTRGLGQMATNAETIKQQVEDFKSVVPLVQVSEGSVMQCKLIALINH